SKCISSIGSSRMYGKGTLAELSFLAGRHSSNLLPIVRGCPVPVKIDLVIFRKTPSYYSQHCARRAYVHTRIKTWHYLKWSGFDDATLLTNHGDSVVPCHSCRHEKTLYRTARRICCSDWSEIVVTLLKRTSARALIIPDRLNIFSWCEPGRSYKQMGTGRARGGAQADGVILRRSMRRRYP